jgi:hypothetical protein
MPKRIRKTGPDLNQLAQHVLMRSTESVQKDAPVETSEEQIRRVMQEMGRRGGKKGGAVRAANMTKEQRHNAASRAARVRWGKDLQPGGAVTDSKTDMERQDARTRAAERLLAILDQNAEGLSPEERERKWDALEKAVSESSLFKRDPPAKPQAPSAVPRRSTRRTA